jgi:hypothetical protein
LRDELGPFEERPVDVLVWGIGEPERRDVTKTGGIPYRPASMPWPREVDGRPIDFLAQIRFTESVDHVHPTPSDVLLIFSNINAPGAGECTYDFYFEWHPLGLRDLVQAHQVPIVERIFTHFDFERGFANEQRRMRITDGFVPCYGVRHRTTEIFDPRVIAHVERILKAAHPGKEDRQWQRHRNIPYICQVESTKIGGTPLLHPEYTPQPLGRHVVTLHSIYPGSEYPWVNHPEPLTPDTSISDYLQVPFDCGFFTFYLDSHNQVRCALAVPPDD